ncbi:unnamed protein product [Clonostachys rosea]|uniref:Uncharacterized protein n=1 Tax=Bionectria ochroleuca TaxID=29856 RepID=A0ABY6UNX4_BIOOC|nr:unnamed protein product [Clonostachys rosea]
MFIIEISWKEPEVRLSSSNIATNEALERDVHWASILNVSQGTAVREKGRTNQDKGGGMY